MRTLRNNTIEVFFLVSVLALIGMVFFQRNELSRDVYIQTMIQIAVLSILLMPQFIAFAKSKNNDESRSAEVDKE